MRCVSLGCLSLVGLVMAAGCSQSDPDQTTVTAKPQPAGTFQAATDVLQQQQPLDPATTKAIGATANAFMRAILSGDSAHAAALLTVKGTQRYQADQGLLSAMGMQVEKLTVAEVRLLSAGEAAAQCLVTETGATAPQELCCLLKLEAGGWRVCGMACDTGDGSATVVSFEEDIQSSSSPQFVEGPAPTGGDIPHTANTPTTNEIR